LAALFSHEITPLLESMADPRAIDHKKWIAKPASVSRPTRGTV
jgi:hypothetical protein